MNESDVAEKTLEIAIKMVLDDRNRLLKENKRLKEQLNTLHSMMLAAKERGDELAWELDMTKKENDTN